MAAGSDKTPQPLDYSKLPNPRRISRRNVIFLTGICLIYGSFLIMLVLFAIDLIGAGSRPLSDDRGLTALALIIPVGLIVLLTSIFRWAWRRVRNEEVDP